VDLSWVREREGQGRVGHGSADLSRVRERGRGARVFFFDKSITSVGHP
jgi:hypothetical protein